MVRQKEIFKGRNKNLGINLCFILFTSGTRKTWWHFSNGESGIIEYLSIEKVRYHIWRFAEKRMTKYSFGSTPYVTELCVGPRYMGNIYHLEDFKSAIFVPFEDTKMPIPVGYKRYLTEVLGIICNCHQRKIANPIMKR